MESTSPNVLIDNAQLVLKGVRRWAVERGLASLKLPAKCLNN